MKQSCCEAHYTGEDKLELINDSANDDICKTGICSWDSIENKKPNLENYFNMYSMCFNERDYTTTGSSIFIEKTNEDLMTMDEGLFKLKNGSKLYYIISISIHKLFIVFLMCFT